jgi:hypothetical protein
MFYSKINMKRSDLCGVVAYSGDEEDKLKKEYHDYFEFEA